MFFSPLKFYFILPMVRHYLTLVIINGQVTLFLPSAYTGSKNRACFLDAMPNQGKSLLLQTPFAVRYLGLKCAHTMFLSQSSGTLLVVSPIPSLRGLP